MVLRPSCHIVHLVHHYAYFFWVLVDVACTHAHRSQGRYVILALLYHKTIIHLLKTMNFQFIDVSWWKLLPRYLLCLYCGHVLLSYILRRGH